MTGITFTTTPPEFTGITPSTGSSVNSTNVAYTLNESITSGSVTFTRTGGTEDSSPHVVNLSDNELNAGTTTLTNPATLVDGAIYKITYVGVDLAGNQGADETINLTYDSSAPTLNKVVGNNICVSKSLPESGLARLPCCKLIFATQFQVFISCSLNLVCLTNQMSRCHAKFVLVGLQWCP